MNWFLWGMTNKHNQLPIIGNTTYYHRIIIPNNYLSPWLAIFLPQTENVFLDTSFAGYSMKMNIIIVWWYASNDYLRDTPETTNLASLFLCLACNFGFLNELVSMNGKELCSLYLRYKNHLVQFFNEHLTCLADQK